MQKKKIFEGRTCLFLQLCHYITNEKTHKSNMQNFMVIIMFFHNYTIYYFLFSLFIYFYDNVIQRSKKLVILVLHSIIPSKKSTLYDFTFQNTHKLDYLPDLAEENPQYKFQNFNPLDWKSSKLNTFTLPDGEELNTDAYFRYVELTIISKYNYNT